MHRTLGLSLKQLCSCVFSFKSGQAAHVPRRTRHTYYRACYAVVHHSAVEAEKKNRLLEPFFFFLHKLHIFLKHRDIRAKDEPIEAI